MNETDKIKSVLICLECCVSIKFGHEERKVNY